MEKEFAIKSLPPFLKVDVEKEHGQLLEAGTVKEGDPHFFEHLSEDLKSRLTEHAVTLGKPQVFNAGDELEEENDGPPARTEGEISADQVESVRTAFTKETYRHGNRQPTAHVPTERKETKGMLEVSDSEQVVAAFTSRKRVQETRA